MTWQEFLDDQINTDKQYTLQVKLGKKTFTFTDYYFPFKIDAEIQQRKLQSLYPNVDIEIIEVK